jgi:hypothetical protein
MSSLVSETTIVRNEERVATFCIGTLRFWLASSRSHWCLSVQLGFCVDGEDHTPATHSVDESTAIISHKKMRDSERLIL